MTTATSVMMKGPICRLFSHLLIVRSHHLPHIGAVLVCACRSVGLLTIIPVNCSTATAFFVHRLCDIGSATARVQAGLHGILSIVFGPHEQGNIRLLIIALATY